MDLIAEVFYTNALNADLAVAKTAAMVKIVPITLQKILVALAETAEVS